MTNRSFGPGRGLPALLLIVSLFSAQCGDDGEAVAGVRVDRGPGDRARYGSETTVVVSEEGTSIITGKPGTDCVQVGGACVDLTEETGRYCGEEGAQADIIVVDGEVVDVICYPPASEGTPIEEVSETDGGNIEIPQPENGAVVVFDEETDGVPIEGNLTIDAERTTIYGNGIDVTIIDGNLDLLSNNSRVRGLTVEGDVHYHLNSNNSALSFCKIHGNLQVDSNNFVGLECQVFGNVQVRGNNPTLVNIGVGGDWQITGNGPLCDGCYSFDDRDGDFVVDPDERGEDLTCGDRPGVGS